MLAVALRSVLAKKRRLVGTALSVVLGIAFLSGTLVFTDTIRRTFDDLFAGIYDETDTYVRSSSTVELDAGGEQRDRMPGSVVDVVRSVDGVLAADGFVGGYAQIVGADGEAIGNPGQGAPTLGLSAVADSLSLWQLTPGSRAPGAGEVVIDVASAERGELAVGDRVTVLTQTGPHTFDLVGTATFGSVESPGGASTAIFDLATAQDVMLGGADEIDAVMVDAEPGVSESVLTDRIAAVLPDGIEALTGSAITAEVQSDMAEGLSFFGTFLLVFAGIGLIVACFTIYNTFQIVVAQRTREMALLRAVGATRRQVLGSQLLEACLIGAVASVAGLVAGVGVAGGLEALMAGFGVDIPAGGTVVLGRTVVVAVVVGLVVTVGSAVLPSFAASRVPPLAAIRAVGTGATPTASRRRGVIGGAITGLGGGAFALGLASSEVAWIGLGAIAAFAGVFTLGPLLARPVAVVLGAPVVRAFGVTGLLARENAVRSPKRTARTGGALMVGVSVVVAITLIAAAAKTWSRDVIGGQFTGDYVVSTTSFGFGGLSPQVAADLNDVPEVDAATGIRIGAAHDVDRDRDLGYVAVDPATVGRVFDLGLVEGDVGSLIADGIFLDDGEASSRGLDVGDTIDLAFLDGATRSLTVQGIYTEDDLAGRYVLSQDLHEATGVDQFDFAVYITVTAGVDDADAEAAIAAVSDAYPNAELQSRSDYIDAQAEQIDQLVNMMYGLLGLAVLIALSSIANSIGLSIYERTHELGLLRAVGMTRHQTASAVRWEAGIVATLGTVLGLGLGVAFGVALSVTLGGASSVTFPITGLAVIVATGILGGVLAAIRPARRAAHLDVLRAVASG